MNIMNIPGFTAEASLNKTSGHYCTTYNVAASTGDVIPALLPGRTSPLGDPSLGFLDRCRLGCWLKCVYIDKNEKIICDLYCDCLG
jgi:hypothetical protein